MKIKGKYRKQTRGGGARPGRGAHPTRPQFEDAPVQGSPASAPVRASEERRVREWGAVGGCGGGTCADFGRFQLLRDSRRCVVEEAATAAAAAPGGSELLLEALDADGAKLGALASGLVAAALAGEATRVGGVLIQALGVQPDVSAHLVELVPSALLTERFDPPLSEGKPSRTQRFRALELFLRTTLLRAGSGDRAVPREVGSRLHGLLVRIAVSEESLQEPILDLLQSLLPWYGRGSVLDWTWRLGVVTDLADVSEEFELAGLALCVVEALTQLVAEFHANFSVRPALLQIGRCLPLARGEGGAGGLASVARIAPLLPLLELRDQALLLALLCNLFSDAQGRLSAPQDPSGAGASASHLLILPVLCHKAQIGRESDFLTSSIFLALLKSTGNRGDPLQSDIFEGSERFPASFQAAAEALRAFSGPTGAQALVSCLKDLQSKVANPRNVAIAKEKRAAPNMGALHQELLFAEHSLLTALVSHSGLDFSTFRAAMEHHRASVEFSVTMMPLLLSRLQEASTGGGAPADSRQAREVLDILEGLVTAGHNDFSVGMVGKVLTVLSGPHNPPYLQAAAVRMLVALWEENDKAFPFLKGALARERPERDPLILRYSRGLAVSAVCASDSFRAVDLLKPIQLLLEDSDDHVRSLGMESIHSLCEDDTLDFYAAWRFLSKRFPTLPEQPRTARGWILVQSGASLDADFYPEAAKEVLENIWAASRSSVPAVREGAYIALQGFPPEQMEKLDFPFQTEDFVKMLRNETDPKSFPLIANVLKRALAYDHVNRRSVMVRSGNNSQDFEQKNILALVSRHLPQRACDFWLNNAVPAEARLSAAAAQACFLPRRDGELEVTGQRNTALVQYATEVSRLLLCTEGREVSFELTTPRLASSFMSRWFQAARSAVEPLNDSLKAYRLIEATISQAEFEHPQALDSSCMWRGLLCSQLKGTPEASEVASGFAAFAIERFHEKIATVDRKCALLRALAMVLPCVQDEETRLTVTDLLCEAVVPVGGSQPGCGHLMSAAAVHLAAMFEQLMSRSQTLSSRSLSLLPKILAAVLYPFENLHPGDGVRGLIASSPYELEEPSLSAHFSHLTDEDQASAVTGLFISVGRIANALAAAHELDFGKAAASLAISSLEAVVSQNLAPAAEVGVVKGVVAALPSLMESLLNSGTKVEYMRSLELLESITSGGRRHADGMFGPVLECLGAMVHAGVISGIPLKLSQISSIASTMKDSMDASDASSALKASCVLGLSNMLGAEVNVATTKSKPSSAIGVPRETPGVDGGDFSVRCPLLLEHRTTRLVKNILSFIEEKAFQEHGDILVRRAAFTAIGCLKLSTRRITKATTSAGEMASLPGTGATSESIACMLSELESNGQDGGDKLATLVACLSTLPRFPAMNWPAVLKRLLHHASCDVQSGSVGLLVACCDATRFKGGDVQDIWDTFEGLFVPQKFVCLSVAAQNSVLGGFSDIFDHLPQSQVLRQIKALPSLAAEAESGSVAAATSAASVWDCIASIVRRTDDSALKSAICSVAERLLGRMTHTRATSGVSGIGTLECAELKSAQACLCQFDKALLLKILPIKVREARADKASVRAVLLRSHLVLAGALNLDHLAPCVAWMLTCGEKVDFLHGVLARSTSSALKAMSPAACTRWLSEILEITLDAADPMVGFVYLTRVVGDYILFDACPLLRYAGLISETALKEQIQVLWPILLNDHGFVSHRGPLLTKLFNLASKLEHREDSVRILIALNACRGSLSLTTTEKILTASACGDFSP